MQCFEYEGNGEYPFPSGSDISATALLRSAGGWSQSGATCLTCGIGVNSVGFATLEEQREHFKSDWHRCNVKRKVTGQHILSEADFEAILANGGDDVDSISGAKITPKAD